MMTDNRTIGFRKVRIRSAKISLLMNSGLTLQNRAYGFNAPRTLLIKSNNKNKTLKYTLSLSMIVNQTTPFEYVCRCFGIYACRPGHQCCWRMDSCSFVAYEQFTPTKRLNSHIYWESHENKNEKIKHELFTLIFENSSLPACHWRRMYWIYVYRYWKMSPFVVNTTVHKSNRYQFARYTT